MCAVTLNSNLCAIWCTPDMIPASVMLFLVLPLCMCCSAVCIMLSPPALLWNDKEQRIV